MESITGLQIKIDVLRHRISSQVEALQFLEGALASEADDIRMQQQIAWLDTLRDRVVEGVRQEQRAEACAHSAFCEARSGSSLMGFAVGTLMGVILKPTGVSPYVSGARKAADILRQTAPFGTVMVRVGPSSGIPSDIGVVSVSRMARERKIPESEIIADIERQGNRLMELKDFLDELDRLKGRVLGE